jgi:hypothetical protein
MARLKAEKFSVSSFQTEKMAQWWRERMFYPDRGAIGNRCEKL